MNQEKESKQISIDLEKISRIEVINHAENDLEKGRLMVLYKNLGHFETVFIQVQDEGRTMKVFLG